MVNYTPAAYPRRSKQPNVLSELTYQLQLLYYRYELITGQYVMSAGEKAAYNLILLSILIFALTAVVYYLPRSLLLATNRLSYYLTGTHKIRVSRVIHSSRADIASLFDNGSTLNTTISLPRS